MTTPDDAFRKAEPAEGSGPPVGHPPAPGYPPAPPGYVPPPGYAPPPGYGSAPGGPYPGPQQTSTRAIIALVCAVGSFLVFPLVPAIVALALAPGATQEIRASGGRLTGEGLVTGARITAWLNIGLTVLVLVLVVLAFVVFAGAGVGAGIASTSRS